MKYQISCLIVIIFCITSTLNTACDNAGMTASALCTANTTCEWKENTTAEDKDQCDGKCFWNADTSECEDGTKSSTGLCTAATTKAACDVNCTWTEVFYCTVKTASPTNDPAQGSGFGLKNSIMIALGFFLF